MGVVATKWVWSFHCPYIFWKSWPLGHVQISTCSALGLFSERNINEKVLVERIHARNQTNCAFCDKKHETCLVSFFFLAMKSINSIIIWHKLMSRGHQGSNRRRLHFLKYFLGCLETMYHVLKFLKIL